MPQFDEKHVKVCGGIIVWDGLTRPETVTQGKQAGKLKYTLKCVFPPNCPDLPLFQQLAQQCLQESKFAGVLPQGGRMPIVAVGAQEFEGMFPGWACINFKTTLKAPDVYDEQGNLLDPMQYGQQVYTGQKVDILAHCYDYDNQSKGVSAGMDGLSIIMSANAQRLQIGGGGVDTSQAFGGGGGGGQPQQNNNNGGGGWGNQNNGQPQQNNNNNANNNNGGQPQQNWDQNNGGGNNNNANNGGQPQQNWDQNNNNANANNDGGGNGGQPQQAHNFMPGQNNGGGNGGGNGNGWG